MGGGRHGDAVLGTVIAAERRDNVTGTTVQPQAVLPVHPIATPGIGRTIGERTPAGREEEHVAEHGPRLADKVVIVGAHEGLAFGGQMGQKTGLVPGHAAFAQPLGMGGAHVEDQGQIGLEDGAQLVHVALVADTGFEDPEVLVPVGLEHAQGHAHLIVEVEGIAGGLAAPRQHMGQQFLDRGLARGAGDAHHPGRGLAAPEGGHGAQGAHRILDQQDRHGQAFQRAGSQHGHSALFHGTGGKVMAVHTLTGDADEQAAGRGLAAVRDDRSDRHPAVGHLHIPGTAQTTNDFSKI